MGGAREKCVDSSGLEIKALRLGGRLGIGEKEKRYEG